MSSRREQRRRLSYAGLGALAVLAVAASALGFVRIYSNGFGSRPEYREIKMVSAGNACLREHLDRRGVFKATVTDGPRVCRLGPPVQGADASPDHRFDVAGRISQDTPGVVRSDAYLTVSVRVGGGNHYELRIFPKERDYSLRRQPGGAMFPANGGNGAIKGIGKLNNMTLIAENDVIKAIVNGTKVAQVTDPSPGDVRGPRLEFGVGNRKDTEKNTIAGFDDLAVGVPDP